MADKIEAALAFSLEVEAELIAAAGNYRVSTRERHLIDRATLAIWGFQRAIEPALRSNTEDQTNG